MAALRLEIGLLPIEAFQLGMVGLGTIEDFLTVDKSDGCLGDPLEHFN